MRICSWIGASGFHLGWCVTDVIADHWWSCTFTSEVVADVGLTKATCSVRMLWHLGREYFSIWGATRQRVSNRVISPLTIRIGHIFFCTTLHFMASISKIFLWNKRGRPLLKYIRNKHKRAKAGLQLRIKKQGKSERKWKKLRRYVDPWRHIWLTSWFSS
jgi:hypothetical protein